MSAEVRFFGRAFTSSLFSFRIWRVEIWKVLVEFQTGVSDPDFALEGVLEGILYIGCTLRKALYISNSYFVIFVMLKGQPMGSVLRGGREDDYHNFRIREPRVERGYTLLRLSRETGISLMTLEKYEKFNIAPSKANLYTIGKVLGVQYTEEDWQEMKYLSEQVKKKRAGKKSRIDDLSNLDELGQWKMPDRKRFLSLDETDEPSTSDDYTVNEAREISGEAENERSLLLRHIRQTLRKAGFTYRDSEIIILRAYGHTLKSISGIFGEKITRQRVSQIIKDLEIVRPVLEIIWNGKDIEEDYIAVGLDDQDLLEGLEKELGDAA